MTWIEAFVLGVLQGTTEFLPVSSSGHLVIGKELFGIEVHGASFEVVVHAATVLSTITVFLKEIFRIILHLRQEVRYVLLLLLSMLPVLVVGLFFKAQVETLFGRGLVIVGAMLMVTALLLILAQAKSNVSAAGASNVSAAGVSTVSSAGVSNVSSGGVSTVSSGGASPVRRTSSLTYKDAFIMGVAQAVAVLPGLSRSGATISIGLMLGKERAEVAKFSFLMVLIPILGEAFLDLMKGGFAPEVTGIGVGALLIGFVAAYLSGLAACSGMVAFVKRARLWGFALYCALVGALCLLYHFFI